MNSIRTIFLFGINLFLLTCISSADVVVHIDTDLSSPGIQTARAVSSGESVSVGVFIELTNSPPDVSLSSYGFGIRFDTSEMDLVSREDFALPQMQILDNSKPSSELAGSNDPTLGSGDYGDSRRINALAIGLGPTATLPPTLVSQIEFRLTNAGGGIADIDIVAGNFEQAFDGLFDNSGADLIIGNRVRFGSASFTAVPEPNGTVVVAASIGCFVFCRRRGRHGVA